MTFPMMPNPTIFRPIPTVTFLGGTEGGFAGFGGAITMASGPRQDRFLMLTIAFTGTATASCTIDGVSVPVWYPQYDGTINSVDGSQAGYAVARVPTGTTVPFTFSGAGQTAVYEILGLESVIPYDGERVNGTPSASGSITMQEGGMIFANLYSSNDNYSFTWSSPMIRTVNNTSYGTSRGASAAYRANTPSGDYTVSASMGSGTIYLGAAVFR